MPFGLTDLFGFRFLKWISGATLLIAIGDITLMVSHLRGSGSGALLMGLKIQAN